MVTTSHSITVMSMLAVFSSWQAAPGRNAGVRAFIPASVNIGGKAGGSALSVEKRN